MGPTRRMLSALPSTLSDNRDRSDGSSSGLVSSSAAAGTLSMAHQIVSTTPAHAWYNKCGHAPQLFIETGHRWAQVLKVCFDPASRCAPLDTCSLCSSVAKDVRAATIVESYGVVFRDAGPPLYFLDDGLPPVKRPVVVVPGAMQRGCQTCATACGVRRRWSAAYRSTSSRMAPHSASSSTMAWWCCSMSVPSSSFRAFLSHHLYG